MIKHIGSVHNKVENYLPKEFHLPRSSIGNFLKVPSTTDSRDSTLVQKVRKLKCQLCQSRFVSRSKLYAHYSISHYKEDLAQHVDQNTLECPFCGEKKTVMARVWKQSRIIIIKLNVLHFKKYLFLAFTTLHSCLS